MDAIVAMNKMNLKIISGIFFFGDIAFLLMYVTNDWQSIALLFALSTLNFVAGLTNRRYVNVIVLFSAIIVASYFVLSSIYCVILLHFPVQSPLALFVLLALSGCLCSIVGSIRSIKKKKQHNPEFDFENESINSETK